MQADIPIPRVRELGFRLARHDMLVASMSMLTFAMEPGEGEDEGNRQREDEEDRHEPDEEDDEEDEEEDEDQEMGDIDECPDERMGGQQWEHAGGYEHEYEYDQERHADEHEGRHDGEDEGSAMGAEDRGGIGPRRRQKTRKPRRPYTVTMALRKTNWFESSLGWEDEHFRVVYR
jgi:hypothetical protein